jgi:general secretion pathway protein K
MRRGQARPERGFALVAVLLVLAVLGIVGAEFAFSMRLEASAVRAYKDAMLGSHLAEAAIEQAKREIVADYKYVGLQKVGDQDLLTFYAADGTEIPRLPREKVPLGSGSFSYTITDEQSRLNVNTSPPDRLDRLMLCREIDKSVRDVIVDSVQDWKDADEEHRVNGAESEDTYLKLEVPYRSHNRNLDSVRELLQVKGVTPALLYGTPDKPGLAADLTVKAQGQPNINTVGWNVFCALGGSQAEFGAIEQLRRDRVFTETNRPTQLGIQSGSDLKSSTFRIEAEGIVDGRVGARITAVLQKPLVGAGAAAGAGVAVREWSAGR